MDAFANVRIDATTGRRDTQTVVAGGSRAHPPRIDGVQLVELGNVLTRSGSLLELFRTDWPSVSIVPAQVILVQLNAAAVTDWHCHDRQTDHLIGISGNIRLALWDGRTASPTHGLSEVLRLGVLRPTMAIVPPGVWHGLRNESGATASYINVVDHTYDHMQPDNWRLQPGTAGVPDIL